MIGLDRRLANGVVRGESELARLGHVTPASVSQMMGIRTLSTEKHNKIRQLPRSDKGRVRV